MIQKKKKLFNYNTKVIYHILFYSQQQSNYILPDIISDDFCKQSICNEPWIAQRQKNGVENQMLFYNHIIKSTSYSTCLTHNYVQ